VSPTIQPTEPWPRPQK